MANSRFQYVKKFELPDALLQDTFLITRLDGHRFTKFTSEHGYSKPNDERGLLLMAECARQVMSEWPDVVMSYGQSDEFSFLLPASSSLYGRRSAKITTSFVSLFSSSFVFFWPKYFPEIPLLYPPNFDARVVSYPTTEHVRDYFGWRQADCHVNNLYNTCFWALVAAGNSKQDAQAALKGTSSGDKHELLFSTFGINYNEIPERFRKGTILYRVRVGSFATRLVQAHGSVGPARSQTESRDAALVSNKPGEGCDRGGLGGKRMLAGGDTNSLGEDEVSLGKAAVAGSQDSNLLLQMSAAVQGTTTDNTAISNSPLTAKQGQLLSQHFEDTCKNANVGKVPGGGRMGGRDKRLIKKGHAPPSVVHEATCDIIRDDFWIRHPHILAGSSIHRNSRSSEKREQA